MRRTWVACVILLAVLAIGCGGCGGRGERGKNADYDRPKATEKR